MFLVGPEWTRGEKYESHRPRRVARVVRALGGQQLRIAVFSDCYLPAINGVVTSICQQVEILRSLGHHVDLYCPDYSEIPEFEERVFRLWARPFPLHKREQMTFPWPPRLLRQMWTEEYDVFHIQTPFSVGLLGLFTAFARGIPRVFHHHTLWEEYVDYLPVPPRFTAAASVALCRGLANRCQGVVAPSAQVLERFAAQGVKTAMTVIPTGIKASRFQDGTRRPEWQEEHKVCLYMGRLAHEKSLDALLRVFARIHQDQPQARLWLVGDGPARADLEAQSVELGLADVCQFFGFVERETLRDFVASADVFLFTSLTETQGLVLLEAQAGGLPVVAFEASGVNEAVDPGVTGYLVEEGREDLMASAALKIMSEPELWARFSEEAVRWSEKFSVESMGEALVCTYETASRSAKKPAK